MGKLSDNMTDKQEKVAIVCEGMLRQVFNPIEFYSLVTAFACGILQEMTDEDTAYSYQDQIAKTFECCVHDYEQRMANKEKKK